eukprot:1136563-Pelagomonas_calceolata.AAC.1
MNADIIKLHLIPRIQQYCFQGLGSDLQGVSWHIQTYLLLLSWPANKAWERPYIAAFKNLPKEGYSKASTQRPGFIKQLNRLLRFLLKRKEKINYAGRESRESPPPRSYKEEKANGDLEGNWMHRAPEPGCEKQWAGSLSKFIGALMVQSKLFKLILGMISIAGTLNQFKQLGLVHQCANKLARKLHAHSVMNANKLVITRLAIEKQEYFLQPGYGAGCFQ